MFPNSGNVYFIASSIRMYICTYTCIRKHIYIYICMNVYIYIDTYCLFVCLSIFIYLYIYISLCMVPSPSRDHTLCACIYTYAYILPIHASVFLLSHTRSVPGTILLAFWLCVPTEFPLFLLHCWACRVWGLD